MANTTTLDSPFAELTTLHDRGLGKFHAQVEPIWTVGPKVHGGCLMAVCAAAARQTLANTGVSPAMQPISVSTNFLHAPDPGEVTLTTTLRKRSPQLCHVDVHLQQDHRVAVTAAVTLGILDDREPLHQVPLALSQMPTEPPTTAVHITPQHPMGQVVHIAQGCDLRVDPSTAEFLKGQLGEPLNRMWLRPRERDEKDHNTAILFALMASDISTPVTLNRGMFGWAPTVQLTTYLRRPPMPGWLRVMAAATVLGPTWFEEDHLILDASGRVLVQSRQLAMIPKENTFQ